MATRRARDSSKASFASQSGQYVEAAGVDGMADVFSGGKQVGLTEAEVKDLRSKIGRLAVENDAKTKAMMKEIDRLSTQHPLFGSRQIAAYLAREGTTVVRDRVRCLMATLS